MRYQLISLIVSLLVTPAFSQTQLPEPWRLSKEKESSLRIDLDGDSEPDLAVLATDGKNKKVFAYLKRQGSTKIVELAECGATARSCVLEALPPGRYSTACGKGLVECNGDPEELILKAPVLSLRINDDIVVAIQFSDGKARSIWLTD